MNQAEYTQELYNYQRRRSREVIVGGVGLGGGNPIRVQSMLISDTMNTADAVREALELGENGCEIVRVTAQTRRHAANLEHIVAGIRAAGCNVPMVADIHFKPDAAMEAAKWVEKVRINPGNYADKKKFELREYTDGQYAEEIVRIAEQFTPLVKRCKERGVAMRIGTNHGSLSDRIMNRHGDTPRGMVESALEFARIARGLDYHDFVFSMKASNPKVMIEAYRLLVDALEAEGPDWNYPLHLGVTEAGDGEDGRIKSAIGIGSLLLDGIGDTVRVSLTEDALREIPVAQALLACSEQQVATGGLSGRPEPLPFDPFDYTRRASEKMEVQGIGVGGGETVRVMISEEKFKAVEHKLKELGEFQPEIILESSGIVAIDPRDDLAVAGVNQFPDPALVTLPDELDLPVVAGFRLLAARIDQRHPLVLKDSLLINTDSDKDFLDTLLVAAVNIGALLCDGIGDAVLIQGEQAPGQTLRLAYNILQASGTRIFKTDYVACPSCGRTLFDLQETTARIREATGHLKGVRIAVMGCIVNGPGEMADADFGYVGGAPEKVNLYVGKQAVKFNIPQDQAVDQLVALIKEHGRWVEPPEQLSAAAG
ncbi:MAG: (E)-4-hydroxy-3-methylbut-2-enyl-diphosphate synthase [Verrucomicrobiaceae bacterium]|nr:(E)-4-hydroxy-3-methylbut-2-enyl-diphosphate synthase [Verrucomicrobiaceae bacterium]